MRINQVQPINLIDSSSREDSCNAWLLRWHNGAAAQVERNNAERRVEFDPRADRALGPHLLAPAQQLIPNRRAVRVVHSAPREVGEHWTRTSFGHRTDEQRVTPQELLVDSVRARVERRAIEIGVQLD